MKSRCGKKIIYGIILAIIIMIAYIMSAFFYQIMLIQGDSMYPTYKNLSMVILDKHSMDYEKGEVIAFRTENIKGVLVKRVVGIPGDKVCIENGKVYVNNNPLEYYDGIEYAGLLSEPITLGIDEYLVLGDNIEESIDSRYETVGIVYDKDIIGEVCFPRK